MLQEWSESSGIVQATLPNVFEYFGSQGAQIYWVFEWTNSFLIEHEDIEICSCTFSNDNIWWVQEIFFHFRKSRYGDRKIQWLSNLNSWKELPVFFIQKIYEMNANHWMICREWRVLVLKIKTNYTLWFCYFEYCTSL